MSLPFHILDAADTEERLLGQVVVLALAQRIKGLQRVLKLNERALLPGELLGHEEVLREETLNTPGTRHGDLVLFGELVDPEDRDDVLEILVLLQDLLDSLSDAIVVRADVSRVEDAAC